MHKNLYDLTLCMENKIIFCYFEMRDFFIF